MIDQPTAKTYLTKTELYEQFRRHPRTITGDLNKAIATGDRELLLLAQLRTKNNEIIEGIDVTVKTWKTLIDKGENPAWYFDPKFIELVRKRKSRARPAGEQAKPRRTLPETMDESPDYRGDSSMGNAPGLPTDPVMRAVVLEHLHFNDQKHKNDNKELMDRILRLVETNQELQRQTNTLFNQFQEFLKKPNATGLLAQATVQPVKTPVSPESARPRDITVNSASLKVRKTKPKKPVRRKATTRKPTTKNAKGQTKRSAVRKAKKAKPKWYEVPTLKKFLSP